MGVVGLRSNVMRSKRAPIFSVLTLALVGGAAGISDAQSCGELVWSQVDNAGPPGGGSGCVVAFDSRRGVTVLFGGVIEGERTNHTWEWDGYSWRQRPTLGEIPGLWGAAGAFDSRRGRFVVCSGGTWSGDYNNDTWEYDGERWMKVASSGPGFRNHLWQIAYDSKRGRTVLFGGAGPVGEVYFGDTWEWDGVAWARVSDSGPAARSSHGMAYDVARSRVVLHGGGDDRTVFGDTWEWDGSRWELRATAGPHPGGYLRLAYDDERQRVVACGSDIRATNPVFERWEWDGTAWTQSLDKPAPQARTLHNVAYDTARRRLVVFGGSTTFGAYSDTWELDLWSEPPRISTEPESREAAPGTNTVVFRATAVGDSPLSYQWFRDGTPVESSPRVQGARSPFLSLYNIDEDTAGQYTCEVTNACGRTTSVSATLKVSGKTESDTPSGPAAPPGPAKPNDTAHLNPNSP